MWLVYLPVNARWAFQFGDALVRLEGYPLFYRSRMLAKIAATAKGLTVSKTGKVGVSK